MRYLAIILGVSMLLGATQASAIEIRSALKDDICLAVQGGAPMSAGANVYVVPCMPGDFRQMWEIESFKNLQMLKSVYQDQGADLCVDIHNAKTTPGTNVQLYGCNQTAAQFWIADGEVTQMSSRVL